MRYVGDDKGCKVIVGRADETSFLDSHLENIPHTHMVTLQQGTARYHTHTWSHFSKELQHITHTHTHTTA